MHFPKLRGRVCSAALLLAGLSVTLYSHAQSIGVGIDAASQSVKSTFANVSTLILVIGGVIGLVGGIRVYIKWQNGDQDINKHIVGWLGSSVFLLLVGAVLKAIYPV